ncbi:MAG: TIR domain-containing protein [Promethearchaeota archaeon]
MQNKSKSDKSGILIFVSYATKDVDFFRIRSIAEQLTDFEGIDDVLYWQEDMHDNIFKFMNDNLGKCDVVLLFCSKNSLNSIPVEKEWTAADSLGKPIIPIFTKAEDIPPLLSSRLGLEFNSSNLQKTIQNLYDLIIKKAIENVDLRSQLRRVRKEKNYLIILNSVILISSLYLIFLKNQINVNYPLYWATSRELANLLFIGLLGILILAIYFLFYQIRSLISSIHNKGKILRDFFKYILSSFSIITILYFLINRSYYFGNFFMLLFLYTPTISFLFGVFLYLTLKKTQLKELRKIGQKIILIFSLALIFYFPFYLGAVAPISNPNVIISPQPVEIEYDYGGKVQDVKEVEVIIKSVEGNARNINVSISAPNNFSYWIDEILNDTKAITYLEYGQIISFLLEIQPSASVGNGTYLITINLYYESVLGNSYETFSNVKVIIGMYFPPIPISGTPITLLITISGIAITILFFKEINKKKRYPRNKADKF